MTNTTDPRVDAAARAIQVAAAGRNPLHWDEVSDLWQEQYRREAVAALCAADAVRIGGRRVVDGKLGFLPGDMVRINLKPGDACSEFDGRHGVVTYGPDDGMGWLVSSAPGSLRCVASELSMMVPREDR